MDPKVTEILIDRIFMSAFIDFWQSVTIGAMLGAMVTYGIMKLREQRREEYEEDEP